MSYDADLRETLVEIRNIPFQAFPLRFSPRVLGRFTAGSRTTHINDMPDHGVVSLLFPAVAALENRGELALYIFNADFQTFRSGRTVDDEAPHFHVFLFSIKMMMNGECLGTSLRGKCQYLLGKSHFLFYNLEFRLRTTVENYDFFAECDIGILFHKQLAEVQLAHIAHLVYLVYLDHLLIILHVYGCKQVVV